MMVGSMGVITDGDDGDSCSSSVTMMGRNCSDDNRFHDVERRNGGDGVAATVITEGVHGFDVDDGGRDGCTMDENRLTSAASAGSASLSSSDS